MLYCSDSLQKRLWSTLGLSGEGGRRRKTASGGACGCSGVVRGAEGGSGDWVSEGARCAGGRGRWSGPRSEEVKAARMGRARGWWAVRRRGRCARARAADAGCAGADGFGRGCGRDCGGGASGAPRAGMRGRHGATGRVLGATMAGSTRALGRGLGAAGGGRGGVAVAHVISSARSYPRQQCKTWLSKAPTRRPRPRQPHPASWPTAPPACPRGWSLGPWPTSPQRGSSTLATKMFGPSTTGRPTTRRARRSRPSAQAARSDSVSDCSSGGSWGIWDKKRRGNAVTSCRFVWLA